MWGGHSCPPPLKLLFGFSRCRKWSRWVLQDKIQVKGGGQECPPHTALAQESDRPLIAAQPDRGGEECRGDCQADPQPRAAQEATRGDMCHWVGWEHIWRRRGNSGRRRRSIGIPPGRRNARC